MTDMKLKARCWRCGTMLFGDLIECRQCFRPLPNEDILTERNTTVSKQSRTTGSQLTYNQALRIQAEQLDFYLTGRPAESARVRAEIAARTKPCPTPDLPMAITEIDELVPRGWVIESLLDIEQPED